MGNTIGRASGLIVRAPDEVAMVVSQKLPVEIYAVIMEYASKIEMKSTLPFEATNIAFLQPTIIVTARNQFNHSSRLGHVIEKWNIETDALLFAIEMENMCTAGPVVLDNGLFACATAGKLSFFSQDGRPVSSSLRWYGGYRAISAMQGGKVIAVTWNNYLVCFNVASDVEWAFKMGPNGNEPLGPTGPTGCLGTLDITGPTGPTGPTNGFVYATRGFAEALDAEGFVDAIDPMGKPCFVSHSEHLGVTVVTTCEDLIITGNEHSSICVWENQEYIRHINTRSGAVMSLCAKGKILFSGSREGTVHVWDLDQGTCLRTFKGHKKAVTNIVLFGRRVATSSSEAVMVWDVETGGCEVLDGHVNPIVSLAAHKDVLISGCSKVMRIWK